MVRERERRWEYVTLKQPHKNRDARVCERACGIRSQIKHGTCELSYQEVFLYVMRQVYA